MESYQCQGVNKSRIWDLYYSVFGLTMFLHYMKFILKRDLVSLSLPTVKKKLVTNFLQRELEIRKNQFKVFRPTMKLADLLNG